MSAFDLVKTGREEAVAYRADELDSLAAPEEDWSSWVIYDPEAEKDIEAIRARKSEITDPNALFKSITLSASDARLVREVLRQRG